MQICLVISSAIPAKILQKFLLEILLLEFLNPVLPGIALDIPRSFQLFHPGWSVSRNSSRDFIEGTPLEISTEITYEIPIGISEQFRPGISRAI